VVSRTNGPIGEFRPEVVHHLLKGNGPSLSAAKAALNSFDVVFMQYEHGIYGGPAGSEVLDLLPALDVPTVVTLHAVLRNPSPRQRQWA
jgi:hypothetical protein